MTAEVLDLMRKRQTLLNFDDVYQSVQKLHDQNYPDVIAPAGDIHVTTQFHQQDEKGKVWHRTMYADVPEIDTRLEVSDWARRQLCNMLGIRWEKWFPPHISDAEAQEEISKRLTRMGARVKLRARQHNRGEREVSGCNGQLRAVLSPGYESIDDVQLFEQLYQLKDRLKGLYFVKRDSEFQTDRSSTYKIIGEPYALGELEREYSNPAVRAYYDDLEDGDLLPELDYVFPGIHLRNSEVGYTAVTIDAYFERLVCLNGATISSKTGRLLYRMHRSISGDVLRELINEALKKMPLVWEQHKHAQQKLQSIPVNDPDNEIRTALSSLRATQTFTDTVLDAFYQEPLMTSYGIFQAITRAARSEENVEKRFELEQLGGRYLAQAA